MECHKFRSFSSMDTVEAQAIKAETTRFLEVPQGRHLGVFSTVILFVSRIMGSGIFAVPSVILLNTGGNKLIYFRMDFYALLLRLPDIPFPRVWFMDTRNPEDVKLPRA